MRYNKDGDESQRQRGFGGKSGGKSGHNAEYFACMGVTEPYLLPDMKTCKLATGPWQNFNLFMIINSWLPVNLCSVSNFQLVLLLFE